MTRHLVAAAQHCEDSPGQPVGTESLLSVLVATTN